MTKSILHRVTMPATVSKLALGLTVAAGVLVAGGAPAMAATQVQANQAQPHAVSARPAAQTTQATTQTVLKVAESQIGVKENAAGGGTPYHSWYMSSPRA